MGPLAESFRRFCERRWASSALVLISVALLFMTARAEPPPFSRQPINFYWRGEMYGGGGTSPDLPMTESEGRAFLTRFAAGIDPVLSWRMQPVAIADPAAPASAYFLREVDYDLNAAKGTDAKALIQIHVDVPPYWYDSKHPGRGSRIHPAYDTRAQRDAVPGDRQALHVLNPDDPDMMRDADRFVDTVVARYRDDPKVKGFLVGCGIGQVEMALSGKGLLFGHGPEEQRAFRDWLKDRGLSLDDLSIRWYGQSKKIASWEDVQCPAPYEFFGWEGTEKVALTGNLIPGERGEFLVRVSADPDADLRDAAEGGGVPGAQSIAMPRPLDTNQFPDNRTLFRREFRLSPGQANSFRKDGCWLYGQGAMRVAINGMDLGRIDGVSTQLAPGQPGNIEHGYPFNPFAIRVERYLKPGINTLALIPELGFYAPLFLSNEPPRRYPYLGRGRNAQYVDWIEWSYARVARVHDHFYSRVRERVANAQLVMFSPLGALLDAAGVLARKYDAAIRCTGGDAYYYPWYARSGMIGGYDGSIEPAGRISAPEILRRSLGWWFFDNAQDVAFFWDLADYASPKSPVRETMIRSKKLLDLFGKFAVRPPALAFLRTSLQFQLEECFQHPLPYLWDPGRGEIQNTGMDFGYVTETPLRAGLPKNIRVLMDTGTAVMTPEMIAALEKWIRGGGTFIALHHTGRHGLLDADAWPIERLSGFAVTGFVERGESIRFEKGQTLWSSVSAAVPGSGSSTDYLGQQSASIGIRLRRVAKDGETIATWPDGSVAIGRRRLGKGMIIVLGSTFWRNARDRAGTYSLADASRPAWLPELLKSVGVPSSVESASNPAVWLREITLKENGDRALIAFNSENRLLRDVQLTWSDLEGERPVDLVSNEPEAGVTREGQKLRFDLEPYQTRVITAK